MVASVQPFFHRDSSTWTYVVAEADGSAAAIIDPVLDFDAKSGRTATASAEALLAFVREHGLDVQWILETHAHADHLSAGDWLRRQLPGARLAIGDGIRTVQQTFAPIFNLDAGFAIDGSQFDHLWQADETFAVGALPARVLGVPGHTDDSSAYLIGDALFTGDSLFMPDSGTARCDFPGGSAATLYRSIQNMYRLPDSTRVFVCHDYGAGGSREVACETTIGAQKQGNIHVRADTGEAEFVQLREARDAELSVPALMLPAVQVNIRAGALPPAEDNGMRYLKLPLNQF
ncbi:MAG: MBL fold metallo-hydrolase [Lysobacter sp.]